MPAPIEALRHLPGGLAHQLRCGERVSVDFGGKDCVEPGVFGFPGRPPLPRLHAIPRPE